VRETTVKKKKEKAKTTIESEDEQLSRGFDRQRPGNMRRSVKENTKRVMMTVIMTLSLFSP
jgi:hypothetical protein